MNRFVPFRVTALDVACASAFIESTGRKKISVELIKLHVETFMDSQKQMPSIPSYKRSCLGEGMDLKEQAIPQKFVDDWEANIMRQRNYCGSAPGSGSKYQETCQ